MTKSMFAVLWMSCCILMCLWGAPVDAAVPDDAVSAQVRRVLDGDTITVVIEDETRTIRMQGIDAPEVTADIKKKDNNPLAFGFDLTPQIKQSMRRKGYEAKNFLAAQLEDQNEVLVQVSGKDNNRLVGYVFLKTTQYPLGLELVRAGHARVYTRRFDFQEEADYLHAQVEAMAARRGLWTLFQKCKNPPELFIGVHADARGHDRQNLNDEYVVIGNVSEERYDLSGHILVDDANHDFLIPEGTVLESGKSLVIRTGAGSDKEGEIFQSMGSSVWNNDGDTVHLLDPDGAVVTRMSYDR